MAFAPKRSTSNKSVQIHRPATWVPYEPKNCKSCFGGCCTLPVLVAPEELFHMGYLGFYEVEGPLDEAARRLIKKGIVAKFLKSRRLFILKQKANNDCIFLDKNRRCKIYNSRPGVCRRFPEGSRRAGFCPYQKKNTPAAGR